MIPTGTRVANGENKYQPVVSGEIGILDKKDKIKEISA